MYIALRDDGDGHIKGYLHMDRESDLAVILLWEDESTLAKLLEIADADGRSDVWVVGSVSRCEILRGFGFRPLDSVEVYARDISGMS